ncbi:hypothetical protein GGS20DRAFT_564418 [Poronia punctata]|nr:hypothetical protein GGS20DRAFT_564418 [Poronia punctata]
MKSNLTCICGLFFLAPLCCANVFKFDILNQRLQSSYLRVFSSKYIFGACLHLRLSSCISFYLNKMIKQQASQT